MMMALVGVGFILVSIAILALVMNMLRLQARSARQAHERLYIRARIAVLERALGGTPLNDGRWVIKLFDQILAPPEPPALPTAEADRPASQPAPSEPTAPTLDYCPRSASGQHSYAYLPAYGRATTLLTCLYCGYRDKRPQRERKRSQNPFQLDDQLRGRE